MRTLFFAVLLAATGLTTTAFLNHEPPTFSRPLAVSAIDNLQTLPGECGDLNGDSAKNIVDVVSTLSILAGSFGTPTDTQLRVADVDLSGQTNPGDTDFMLDHITGAEPELNSCGLVIEAKGAEGVSGSEVSVDVELHHAFSDIAGFTIRAAPEDFGIVEIVDVEFPLLEGELPGCLIATSIIQLDEENWQIVMGDICDVLGGEPAPQNLLRLVVDLKSPGESEVDLQLLQMDDEAGTDLVPATERFVISQPITVEPLP